MIETCRASWMIIFFYLNDNLNIPVCSKLTLMGCLRNLKCLHDPTLCLASCREFLTESIFVMIICPVGCNKCP